MKAAKLSHPDSASSSDGPSFEAVNAAYESLSTPARRSRTDAELDALIARTTERTAGGGLRAKRPPQLTDKERVLAWINSAQGLLIQDVQCFRDSGVLRFAWVAYNVMDGNWVMVPWCAAPPRCSGLLCPLLRLDSHTPVHRYDVDPVR